jgi:hypothetical protein
MGHTSLQEALISLSWKKISFEMGASICLIGGKRNYGRDDGRARGSDLQ